MDSQSTPVGLFWADGTASDDGVVLHEEGIIYDGVAVGYSRYCFLFDARSMKVSSEEPTSICQILCMAAAGRHLPTRNPAPPGQPKMAGDGDKITGGGLLSLEDSQGHLVSQWIVLIEDLEDEYDELKSTRSDRKFPLFHRATVSVRIPIFGVKGLLPTSTCGRACGTPWAAAPLS